jgi:hypothetical protein
LSDIGASARRVKGAFQTVLRRLGHSLEFLFQQMAGLFGMAADPFEETQLVAGCLVGVEEAEIVGHALVEETFELVAE